MSAHLPYCAVPHGGDECTCDDVPETMVQSNNPVVKLVNRISDLEADVDERVQANPDQPKLQRARLALQDAKQALKARETNVARQHLFIASSRLNKERYLKTARWVDDVADDIATELGDGY